MTPSARKLLLLTPAICLLFAATTQATSLPIQISQDNPCFTTYAWNQDTGDGQDDLVDTHYKKNSGTYFNKEKGASEPCNPSSIVRDVYADTELDDKEADFRAVYFADKASFKGINSAIKTLRLSYDTDDPDPDNEVRLTLTSPVANPSPFDATVKWQKLVAEEDTAFNNKGKAIVKDGHWNIRITKEGATHALKGLPPNPASFLTQLIGLPTTATPYLDQSAQEGLDQYTKFEGNYLSSLTSGKEDDYPEYSHEVWRSYEEKLVNGQFSYGKVADEVEEERERYDDNSNGCPLLR